MTSANLNLSSGAASSTNRAAINITASHYITSGFSIGSIVTITPSSNPIEWNPGPSTLSKIAAIDNNPTNGVIYDGSNAITYGAGRPDLFNANGSLFATRVLDYAISNAG